MGTLATCAIAQSFETANNLHFRYEVMNEKKLEMPLTKTVESLFQTGPCSRGTIRRGIYCVPDKESNLELDYAYEYPSNEDNSKALR